MPDINFDCSGGRNKVIRAPQRDFSEPQARTTESTPFIGFAVECIPPMKYDTGDLCEFQVFCGEFTTYLNTTGAGHVSTASPSQCFYTDCDTEDCRISVACNYSCFPVIPGQPYVITPMAHGYDARPLGMACQRIKGIVQASETGPKEIQVKGITTDQTGDDCVFFVCLRLKAGETVAANETVDMVPDCPSQDGDPCCWAIECCEDVPTIPCDCWPDDCVTTDPYTLQIGVAVNIPRPIGPTSCLPNCSEAICPFLSEWTRTLFMPFLSCGEPFVDDTTDTDFDWEFIPELCMEPTGGIPASVSIAARRGIRVVSSNGCESITIQARFDVLNVSNGFPGFPVYTWDQFFTVNIGADCPATLTTNGLTPGFGNPCDFQLNNDWCNWDWLNATATVTLTPT